MHITPRASVMISCGSRGCRLLQQQQRHHPNGFIAQIRRRYLSNNEKVAKGGTETAASDNGPKISAAATNAASTLSSVSEPWNSGSILLLLGFGGVSIMAYEYYLGVVERTDANKMMQEIKETTAIRRHKLMFENKDKPALYQGRITTVYKHMGGSHGLRKAKQDDVVDILQENVGPHGIYNLCRLYDDKKKKPENPEQGRTVKSIGWYPMKYIEKIEEPEEIVEEKPARSGWKRFFGF